MQLPTPETLRSARIELEANAKIARSLVSSLVARRITAESMLEHWAEKMPNAVAIMFEDQVVTWRQANQAVNRYANWFRLQGLDKGSCVALIMDNRPDYLFITLALNRIGATAALINTNLTGAALTHAINVANPQKILAGGNHHKKVQEIYKDLTTVDGADFWIQLEPGQKKPRYGQVINDEVEHASDLRPTRLHTPRRDDHFCYIYTSGTTGLPKAALVTNHRMLIASHVFGAAMFEATPADVIYVTLPLFHSSGMYIGWGSCLVGGATLALRRKFSASAFIDDVRKTGATGMLYIGELCRYLLHTPERPEDRQHNLRVAVGNGLRPDIWEAFQRRFNIGVIREFYGATEGTAALLNFEGRPGMIGRLRSGQVIVKCDPTTGEIIRNRKGRCIPVKPGETGLLLGKISPLIKFDGYLDKRASEQKIVRDVLRKGDRYFNTGDLIQLHENRWASFADRLGDTFRWKGENVSTNEVAELINRAPGVLESNVYGVKVPHTEGRCGMAALTVDENFDLDAFADYVQKNLTRYQLPYFIRLLDSGKMRITGTFKHQKVDYREEAFDPHKVSDPLYFFDGRKYVPLDEALYEKIERGEVLPA